MIHGIGLNRQESAGGDGNWSTCSNVFTDLKNSVALQLRSGCELDMQMMYTLRLD